MGSELWAICGTRLSVEADTQDSANESYYDRYLALKAKYEALLAENEENARVFNERLVDRTTGMLDSLAKPRLSAASFRAGWEQGFTYAKYLKDENLEQALQQHLNPTTTDL